MAKNDNLGDLLTSIANAIRAKKGTSEAINPQNFDSEIASIISGATPQQLAALKAAAEKYDGITVPLGATIDTYPTVIDNIRPMKLTPEAFAAQVSASTTYNVASNKHIRVYGSDHQEYTIQEWNALFVAAGYNKDNMAVQPIGLVIDCHQQKAAYLFDRWKGRQWSICGVSGGEGVAQHSMYEYDQITAAGSGTDVTTGKGWSVTKNGDVLTLTEANTGCSWQMATNCGNIYSMKALNIAERTNAMWAQNEWLRHRFAKKTELTTLEADGTIAPVSILNASGEQAAVNEDMYFWIGGVTTGMLAKYNNNNRHGVSSAYFTSAMADAVYAKQKELGINMNDTGVNSASKPMLVTGAKGAEAVAYGGYWYVITPYISRPSATLTDATFNIPDSPAVYWAKGKGYSLPSDAMLQAMYANWSIVNAMRTYLTTKEGWTLDTIPTGDYIWTAVRYSSNNAWIVNLNVGNVYYPNTYNRCNVCGASAL